MAKLHDYYKDEVVNKLMTEFNYNSVMQVPRVEKITLNMGVGEAIADKKLLDNAAADLTAISGQKTVDHQSTQICCRLQNPSGLSDRL
ncbi:50S ribosomal protein L5 [Salmonella enterica subsp. enterica serovar Braenderup]|nr:50S ribosomal protein L5 [Salmonella enterica subsp. enterica serovar Braenderup]